MKVIRYEDLIRVLTELGLYKPDEVNVNPDEYTSCFGVPIIEAEPVRHGKWIRDMGGCWCSVCKTPNAFWNSLEFRVPCCHNCGAKMDLED